LPPHIERIGLITSESGVVIRDFLTGLGDHGLQIHFYDVRVEGLHAIENIVSAIQWFNEHPQGVQVLVLARGGGSLERLQPFNRTYRRERAIRRHLGVLYFRFFILHWQFTAKMAKNPSARPPLHGNNAGSGQIRKFSFRVV
jgi:hypothetical protein